MSVVKKNTPAAEAETKSPAQKAAATKAAAKATTAPKAAAKPAPKAKPAEAPKAAPVAPKAKPAAEEQVKAGRKQLAALIQEKVKATGKAVPLAIAEVMVVAYEEAVAETLAAGVDVNLPGFGKFIVADREEAQRRNPATGEMVTVPAHKAVRFKVGTKLKKSVNGGVETEEDEDGE